MNFNTIEGLVSAFQNGMTLENPMKIEHFIAKRLRSGIFVKNLAKTLRGLFGGIKLKICFKNEFLVTQDRLFCDFCPNIKKSS